MKLDILTAEDLAPLKELLHQVLVQQTAAAQPADDYLSLDQVAALTGTSRKTVGKWIREGKYDAQGRRITLYTLEFAPGFPRVPRSALLAFGQGLGFEAAQLALPAAAAPKKQAAPVLASAQALRKAS